MDWTGGRRSDNVEDRRGMGVPIGLAGGGLGTVVVIVLALIFGVDPRVLLQNGGPPTEQRVERPAPSQQASPRADPMRDFVALVLADTEDTWTELFLKMNREYREPKLVLFSGSVRSACGIAGAAVGPFYCPPDQKVYLD